MLICMQDDSAMLYALLRLRGETKALKLEKKASIKCLSWLLMGLASNKSCLQSISLTFEVGISSHVDSEVQAISGVRSPWQRDRRAALTVLAI